MRSIGVALTLALLAAPAAEAAKFKVVGPSKLASVKQQNVIKLWKQISRGECDAGYKAVCILSKKPTERWEQTIKQVLWGHYVEGVSAAPSSASKKSITSAVNAVFDAHGALSQKSPAVRQKLADALYDAVKTGKCKVYTGGIWGAFDGDYTHVTVRNPKSNQLFSIYAGYSE